MRVAQVTMGITFAGLATLLVCSSISCGSSEANSIDPAPYLLSEEPGEAIQVKDLCASGENEQEVVVIGRIGGSVDPWVEGAAAFEITDLSLRACSDETEEGESCSCPTPWDYCCESTTGAKVNVHIVDAEGNILEEGAKELFKLEELKTVVVKGTFIREDDGTMRILASGLFIQE